MACPTGTCERIIEIPVYELKEKHEIYHLADVHLGQDLVKVISSIHGASRRERSLTHPVHEDTEGCREK